MKETVRSAKVSLLIVQVPVQTERLNTGGGKNSNPARKSLSLCTIPCPLTRMLTWHQTRSYIRMRDRKPSASLVLRPRIGISIPGTVPLPSPPCVPFCTLARSRGPEKRRNKNNKKCFLPFRLYISHLALSSLPQSLSLVFDIDNPSLFIPFHWLINNLIDTWLNNKINISQILNIRMFRKRSRYFIYFSIFIFLQNYICITLYIIYIIIFSVYNI